MIAPSQLQEQLMHLFQVYPVLSPTMIQALLGSKVRAIVWKPIMEEMISVGQLVRFEVVAKNTYGQLRSYTCIKLVGGDNNRA